MEQKELIRLLERIRNGADEAFSVLADAFGGMTERLVSDFSVGLCSADRSELAQEARLALYRAACTYRRTESVTFGLYARVCVRNALISFSRRRATPKGITLCSVDALLLSEEREPVEPLVEAERLEELMEEMGRVLSAYEAQVFVLLVDGQSNAAIAETLGKSEKSVANTVFRIKSKLREALGS